MNKKRLRMFAGPNGSGKSTLKLWIEKRMPERQLFGNYINPDEIEAHIRTTQTLDFKSYGLNPTKTEVFFSILLFSSKYNYQSRQKNLSTSRGNYHFPE